MYVPLIILSLVTHVYTVLNQTKNTGEKVNETTIKVESFDLNLMKTQRKCIINQLIHK